MLPIMGSLHEGLFIPDKVNTTRFILDRLNPSTGVHYSSIDQ